jgi:hypothetical protein
MNLPAAAYLFVWIAKFWIVRKILSAPRFHGPDWCFDCRVPAGFYDREGREMMHSLYYRIFAPMAIEAVAGAVLWWQNRFFAAFIALGVLYILNPFYYTVLLRGRARWAWKFAIYDQPPVSSVAVAMHRRTLAEFQYSWLVWVLRAGLATGLALVAIAVIRSGAGRALILVPLFTLYLELGLLLTKRALAEWRVSVTPNVNPERFIEWQDAGRRYFIFLCDYMRINMIAFLLIWAALQAWPTGWSGRPRLAPLVAVGAIVVWLPATVALLRLSGRFVALARTLKSEMAGWRPAPARPPEGVFHLRGRLCFEPEEPKVLVAGPRGLALNASSQKTRIYLAYLAGWPAMAAVLVILKK